MVSTQNCARPTRKFLNSHSAPKMLRHLKPARSLLIERQVLKDIFRQTLQLYGILSAHKPLSAAAGHQQIVCAQTVDAGESSRLCVRSLSNKGRTHFISTVREKEGISHMESLLISRLRLLLCRGLDSLASFLQNPPGLPPAPLPPSPPPPPPALPS